MYKLVTKLKSNIVFLKNNLYTILTLLFVLVGVFFISLNFLNITNYLPVFILILLLGLYALQLNTNKMSVTILCLSLFITFLTSILVTTNITENKKKDFINQTEEVKQLIERRVANYTNVLLGTRALFYTHETVDRDIWHKYIESLDLQKNYPGMQAVGFSKVVEPKYKEKLIKAVRKEGFSNFTIWPESERDIYTSIIYIEPFDERNQRAFGFDMFSEEIRNKAMSDARDSGNMTASGKVILKQETETGVQPGFLVYLPIYKNGTNSTTTEDRMKNLDGYVYIPFRINDLMQGVTGKMSLSLDFHIYDGLKSTENNKIFDFNPDHSKFDETTLDEAHLKLTTIYVDGHPWVIKFIDTGNLNNGSVGNWLSILILLIGTLISFLLSGIIYSIDHSKKQAIDYANEVTTDLQANIVNLETNKKELVKILDQIKTEKDKVDKLTQRINIATHSANIGVWELDIDTKDLNWDNQMYKLFGINKDEKTKLPLLKRRTAAIFPEDLEKIESNFKKAKVDKSITILDNIFRIHYGDKTIHYLRDQSSIERDAKGKITKLIGVTFDITREKEVDLEKTEFVTLTSHQLKTPVGAISWSLELLKNGDYGPLNKKQTKVVSDMYGMNQRMNELITTLLNISRIELGVFMIEPTLVDFCKTCDEVLGEFALKIKNKKHKLTKTYDSNLGLIPADKNLLRIIFQNYISNAIKYTPDKGDINVSIQKVNEEIVISVSNNGKSIPASDKNKIFGKLFRASNAQEQDPDGNGLGLYIVKKITENAGGRAWFESENNNHTVFYAVFPLSGMVHKDGTKQLS